MHEAPLDPPKDDFLCPKCKAEDAKIVVRDAVLDALGGFGVDDLFNCRDGEDFLELVRCEVERVIEGAGGKLCYEHESLIKERYDGD